MPTDITPRQSQRNEDERSVTVLPIPSDGVSVMLDNCTVATVRDMQGKAKGVGMGAYKRGGAIPGSRGTIFRLISVVLLAMATSVLLAADGDIDTTFGTGGIAVVNSLLGHSPPIDIEARSIQLDSSGRVVVAGAAQHLDLGGEPTDDSFLIFRLTPGGELDTTFAADYGGYRLVNFDLTGIARFSYDTATDIAIQADGKIVAAGYAYLNGVDTHFAIVRVDDSGNLDATFNESGTAHFGPANGNVIQAMKIDANGNIVLAGGTSYRLGIAAFQSYAAVTRLTPAGQIDGLFNYGAVQEFSFSQPSDAAVDSSAQALAIDDSGRIVTSGGFDTNLVSGAAVQRLTPNGALDPAFAGGAPASILPPGYTASAIHVEPGGGFVVAGYGFAAGTGSVYLAKFLPDGSPDESFGSNGTATLPIAKSGLVDFVAPTKRGGWLLAGPYSEEGVFILKVLGNGQPDTTLAGTGLVVVYFPPNTPETTGELFDMARPALTPDGKLIVAGTTPEAAANGSGNISVMRIFADYDTLFVSSFEGSTTH